MQNLLSTILGNFVFSIFIKFPNFKLYLSNRIISNSNRLQKDEIETENNSQIRNYIVEILKREASLPTIKSEMNIDLSDIQLTNFIQNSINIIKFEYMEKQKKVVIEFQKRYYSHKKTKM